MLSVSSTVHALNLVLNDFTRVEGEQVVMRGSYNERITGVDMEIDRGRLAAFSLGLGNMESIENLEVTNA